MKQYCQLVQFKYVKRMVLDSIKCFFKNMNQQRQNTFQTSLDHIVQIRRSGITKLFIETQRIVQVIKCTLKNSKTISGKWVSDYELEERIKSKLNLVSFNFKILRSRMLNKEKKFLISKQALNLIGPIQRESMNKL
ncbi:unnamed protein product [Paramecium octaurelia]|uniref:Uncharacterized protein n=1 Tax=Paramecium octaurelia TaxID=43137 RepID=A0A8S1YBV1_PAROT|nr:unnamed protein product [Paramecium octaurelia]